MNYVDIQDAPWTRNSLFPAPVEVRKNRRTEKPNWGTMTKNFNNGLFNTEFTLYDACRRIEYGATWLAAKLSKREKAGFKSAKFAAVDIDNQETKTPFTLKQALQIAFENNIPPLFYYHTFSHTEEVPRFRLVWELNETMEDANQYQALLSYLISLFDCADPTGKDVSHLWGGGIYLQIAAEPILLDVSRILEKVKSQKPKSLYNNKGTSGRPQTEKAIKVGISASFMEPVDHVNWDTLSKNCRLWNDTVNLRGEEAYHAHYAELIHLAYSASKMVGGIKRLIEAVEGNPQYYIKGKDVTYYTDRIKGVQKRQYDRPQNCKKEFCSFFDNCQNEGSIVDKRFKRNLYIYDYAEPPRITVDDASKQLSAFVDTVIQSPKTGIHLIKADVGLGKTEALINADYRGQRVLIAVPTHQLKGELNPLSGRWADSKYRVESQDEAQYTSDDIEKMKRYELAGLHYSAQAINICDYNKLYNKQNDVAITTQDYALAHIDQVQKTYDLIIFDEDITNRFYKTIPVSKTDLQKYLSWMIDEGVISSNDALQEWREKVRTSKQNVILPPMPQVEVDAEKMIEQMQNDLPPFNVWALMASPSTLVSSGGGGLTYTMKKKVPEGKIIVFSATADEEIYRFLFKGVDIHSYVVPHVERKGKLNFDVHYTYSKGNIYKNGIDKMLTRLNNTYPEFFEKIPTIITFKEFVSQNLSPHRVMVKKGMYFFNTEGKDSLNGKNILVFGKPCPPYSSIISLALAAGYTPTSLQLGYIDLPRCGYGLNFYGFRDKTLNDLLLSAIDTETIQSIGRARLIWNDCEVLVAGLPVEM